MPACNPLAVRERGKAAPMNGHPKSQGGKQIPATKPEDVSNPEPDDPVL